MKLVMTLLVRDEEDIIEENILYHLNRGVDYVIVTDNKSEDKTTEILKKYEAYGVLHFIREEQDNYAQSIWVSRMANLAKTKFNADWIINSDADEFWWPESDTFKDVLKRVPKKYAMVFAPRHNFIVRCVSNSSWYERMVYLNKHSVNALGERLPPKICHRAIEGIRIAQGNHAIQNPRGLKKFPEMPIEILHFPIRTYPQFENKIVKGGSAYKRNREIDPKLGHAWRWLYKQWKQGKLPAFYEQQVWSDERIRQGLEQKIVEKDTRLIDYFINRNLFGEKEA